MQHIGIPKPSQRGTVSHPLHPEEHQHPGPVPDEASNRNVTPSCTQKVQPPVIRQTQQREQAPPRRNTQSRKHDTAKQGRIQNTHNGEKDDCREKCMYVFPA